MITPTDLLNRAVEIAPVPGRDDDRKAWIRHYAAAAMSALAAFRLTERTSPGPQLGYLALSADAAIAAVIALDAPAAEVTRLLWEMSPEGEGDGEVVLEFLAHTLEAHGINPADLYPWYRAEDFTSVLRLPNVEVAS